MYDITNDTFGVLHWDEKRGGYNGTAPFTPERNVSVTLVDVDRDNPNEAIERAAQTYSAIKAREPELQQKTADTLLDNYNDNWCDEEEGDDILDATAFQERITLSAMTFYLDGSAELYYHDGELFGGHTIVVDVNPSGDFQKAHLAG